MEPDELITEMLTNVAGASSGVDTVLRNGPASWSVGFDARVAIDIDINPTARTLVFTCVLGAPKPDRRAEILETLMTYSAMWHETGGVAMALDSPGGDALMLAAMALDAMTEQELGAVLHDLEAKARVWIGFVAHGEFGGADPAGASEHMIRV